MRWVLKTGNHFSSTKITASIKKVAILNGLKCYEQVVIGKQGNQSNGISHKLKCIKTIVTQIMKSSCFQLLYDSAFPTAINGLNAVNALRISHCAVKSKKY